MHLFRQARKTIRQEIQPFILQKANRVALYGTTEATELAFLTLRELGIEASLVFDGTMGRDTFLGIPVRPLSEISSDDFDLIILSNFSPQEQDITFLTNQGIPKEKILTL